MRVQIRLLCLLFATCTLSVIPSITSISAPAIAQTVSSRKAEADQLREQAQKLLDENQPEASLKRLQQALKIYQEIGDRLGQGHTFRLIGNAYSDLKDYEQVIAFQKKALLIAQEIKDKDLEARALNNIGIAYQDLKQLEQALDFLNRSFQIAQGTRNVKMVAISTRNLGKVHEDLKQYAKAISFYEQSLDAARKIPDRSMEMTILLSLGDRLKEDKSYDQAINYYQMGVKLSQEAGNKELTAAFFVFIRDAYFAQRKYVAAIEYLKQALQFSEKLDEKIRGDLFHHIGLSYSYLEQYAQAIEYLKQALPIYQKIQNRDMALLTLVALGSIHGLKEDNEQAVYYHEQALVIAQALKRKDFEAQILGLLGGSYFDLKEHQKSKDSFEKSIALYRDLKKKPEQLNVLVQLVRVQYQIASSSSSVGQELIAQANYILQLVPEALMLSRELKDSMTEKQIRELESYAYKLIGNAYESLIDFSKAEEFFQKALSTAQSSNNLQAERSALVNLQGLYGSKNEFYKNLPLIQRSLQISQKLGSPISEVYDLVGLANHYETNGEIQESLTIHQKALQKVEGISPTSIPKGLQALLQETRIFVRNHLADAYVDARQYDQALETMQQNLQLLESISDPQVKVNTLIRFGEVYVARRNLSAASEKFQQALEIARKNNRPDLETEVLLKLSDNSLDKNDAEQAIAFAQQAMAIAAKVKPTRRDGPQLPLKLQRDARVAIADIYTDRESYNEALATISQLAEQERQLASPIYQATGSQFKLGSIYASLGDYSRATEQFQQMLKKAQSIKHSLLEAQSWNLLSQIAFLQQKPQEALEFAQRGIAVAQKNQLLSYAFANYESLSRAYGELRKEQEAMASAQKALSIARQLKSQSSEKRALALIASLHYRFKRPDDALLNYEAALAINSNSQRRDLLAQTNNSTIYTGLARIYADRNQPVTAIAFYKQAINGIQTKRQKFQTLPTDLQKSFLQATIDFGSVKVSDIYRQFADLLLSQGGILEAQQVLELLKIQEIQEFDRTTRAKISSDGKVILSEAEKLIIEGEKFKSYLALIQRVRECREVQCSETERSKLTELQEKARSEYEKTIAEINADIEKRAEKDKKEFLDPGNALSSKARTLLSNDDRAIIYSLVTNDRIWLIVATKSATLRTFEISVSREKLSKTVGEFRIAMEKCQQSTCTQADTQAVQQISKRLYDWLFPAELRKEIPPEKIKHLMFSLDRNIRYIPMSAMFDGKNYLIENYAISSITTVDRPENQEFPKVNTSVLAMGASQFPNGLPRIPYVELEINEIVKSKPEDPQGIYPGSKFINRDFTIQNLKNSLIDRNILHLASHGVFRLNSPPYIALADENLSLPEIRKLPLDGIDLVVLSACQTALGGRTDEEGVEISSLASAFLEDNRAKSVMASLWNVDDISTSLLMREFYQTLAKTTPQAPITRAAALRQTQQQFLKGEITSKDAKKLRSRASIMVLPAALQREPNQTPDYRHPYYWSPFVLIGSGF